jgi:hypothetical protein
MRTWYRRFDVGDSEPLPVALLRAPAAVAAGAFLVGLGTGAVVAPLGTEASPSAITYVVTMAVCAPFLLPTAWYRRYRTLWLWMAAAAAIATVRAVFMAGFLLPHQSPGPWLLKTAMDLLAAGILWLATLAMRRAPVPDS